MRWKLCCLLYIPQRFVSPSGCCCCFVVPRTTTTTISRSAVINLRVKSDAANFFWCFAIRKAKFQMLDKLGIGFPYSTPPLFLPLPILFISPLDYCTCFLCANVNVLISASAFLHVSRLKYVALFFWRFSHAVNSSLAVSVYPVNYCTEGYNGIMFAVCLAWF